MTAMAVATALDRARAKLNAAGNAFDTAVRSLPGCNPGEDTVMASPQLIALIDRFVKAGRQVKRLERRKPT